METIAEVAAREPQYQKLAEKIFPNGTVARCKKCGKKRNVSTAELAVWIAKGFPSHCGAKIILTNPYTQRDML